MNLDSKYAGFHEIKCREQNTVHECPGDPSISPRESQPFFFFGELVLLLIPVGNNLGNPVERSVFVAARVWSAVCVIIGTPEKSQ